MSLRFAGSSAWPGESHPGSSAVAVIAVDFGPEAVRYSVAGWLLPWPGSRGMPLQLAEDLLQIEVAGVG